MGADILDVAGVQNVATLPTLDEARAKIIGILRSPAQKIASFTCTCFKNRYFSARKIKKITGTNYG